MAKAKVATAKDIALNRWCIEMAMQWPVITTYGNSQGVYSGGGGVAPAQRDADVVGRAGQIINWVKKVQP